MKVMKFGGTSVGTPQRMKEVCTIVQRAGQAPKMVVLSAMSGTTNALVNISECLYKKDIAGAEAIVKRLEEAYMGHADELYSTEEWRTRTKRFIQHEMALLRSFQDELFTSFEEKTIVAQGEILSTNMMANYMLEQGINARLLDALDFMRTDKDGEPDQSAIARNINNVLAATPGADIYITQGFICRNAFGEIDNLLRGGSDYTASLIGAAIAADEIQIWTDIDGMHNGDPRVVENTRPVRRLLFEEAAELAFFGAKILHPTCVQPAKRAGIPVRLLNTMQPEAEGTLITSEAPRVDYRAVAAKDNVVAVKVESKRRMQASGFLSKVFRTFEAYQTAIDMVCTSEVAVSICTDNKTYIDEIAAELEKIGHVTIDHDMCEVSVVGNLDWKISGSEARVLQALKDLPVRMISYGGSNYNISLLVKQADKKAALQRLAQSLF